MVFYAQSTSAVISGRERERERERERIKRGRKVLKDRMLQLRLKLEIISC